MKANKIHEELCGVGCLYGELEMVLNMVKWGMMGKGTMNKTRLQ